MTAFSFSTFLVVIATQILILSAVIIFLRKQYMEAIALAGFCGATGLYVWFHFGLTNLTAESRSLLAPVMTNESLPGAILLIFVVTSLFGKTKRYIRWALTPPVLEVCARFGALFMYGNDLPAKTVVIYGQIAIFLFSGFAMWLIFQHRRRYVMETSENRLTAIYIFISPVILIFILNFSWIVTQFIGGPIFHVSSKVLFTLLLCASLVWQFVYLIRPRLKFYELNQAENITHEDDQDIEDGLTNSDINQIESALNSLSDQVKDKELFLNPDLTLVQLAREVGTNRSSLSQLINKGGQMNFNRYINGFRIDRAKELLKKTDDTIINIAFECGFNSKPTFNRVFKEITQQSPSSFRDKELSGP